MRKNKHTLLLIEIILGCMLLFTIGLILFQMYHDDSPKIMMVLPDIENDKWAGVKYGAKMAASDMGCEVVFEDKEYAQDDEKLEKPYINCKEMGKSLAENLILKYENGLKDKTIGIVYSYREDVHMISDCMEGFENEIYKAKAQIKWKMGLNDSLKEAERISQKEKVDIIMALDNDSLLVAAELAEHGNIHGALVHGIGHCTDAVYYLDNGIIESLIVPDVFMIGYQAYMLELNPDYKDKRQIGYYVLDRNGLFTQDNQALIDVLNR